MCSPCVHGGTGGRPPAHRPVRRYWKAKTARGIAKKIRPIIDMTVLDMTALDMRRRMGDLSGEHHYMDSRRPGTCSEDGKRSGVLASVFLTCRQTDLIMD